MTERGISGQCPTDFKVSPIFLLQILADSFCREEYKTLHIKTILLQCVEDVELSRPAEQVGKPRID